MFLKKTLSQILRAPIQIFMNKCFYESFVANTPKTY